MMKLHHFVNRKEQENMSVFLYSGQDYLKTILVHLPEKVVCHSIRVAKMCRNMAKYVPDELLPEGMDREMYRLALYKAAYYHEIGILIARNDVKQRQIYADKLMINSWEDCSRIAGEDISSPVSRMMVETVRSCRERYDGQGYPDAMAGEGIPFHASLCAIADMVDMIVGNCNGNPPSRRKVDRAIDFIHRNNGIMFRPDAVRCFEQAQEEMFEY